MTDFKALTEAIGRDRKIGTPGLWVYEKVGGSIVWGSPDVLTVARFHCGRNDHGNDARPSRADATRIARLPDLETAYLELCARVQALEGAAIELRDDMLFRAEHKMDVIRGEQYRVVNAGNGAWTRFCEALQPPETDQ